MIAPRMIGAGVRDAYVSGEGFPSFIGVHQDATGRPGSACSASPRAVGSTRAGCLEMSFVDEATLDLFSEQAFGPAFGRVMMSAIDTLVEAGFPPEAVLMELYLSGELAYSFLKMREMGALRAAPAALAHQPVRHDQPQPALLRPRPAAEGEDAGDASRRSAPAPSPASGRPTARASCEIIRRRARCRRRCR